MNYKYKFTNYEPSTITFYSFKVFRSWSQRENHLGTTEDYGLDDNIVHRLSDE